MLIRAQPPKTQPTANIMLLKILETVDPDDYESLQYFQRVMKESGIIAALVDAGVHDGDTVKLYDIEFDYIS